MALYTPRFRKFSVLFQPPEGDSFCRLLLPGLRESNLLRQLLTKLGGVEQVFYSTRRLEQRVDLVTKLPDRPAHLSRCEASQSSYILPLEIEAAVVALSPGLPLLPPLLLKVSVVLYAPQGKFVQIA